MCIQKRKKKERKLKKERKKERKTKSKYTERATNVKKSKWIYIQKDRKKKERKIIDDVCIEINKDNWKCVHTKKKERKKKERKKERI